ncbi:Uncharacterized protein FWK35_00001143 [Aphis craccivora]|uniref:Uncharacterized protein n=1 Tax=Aphis craccivora TaxID=307492 RepID=A0A6G0ZPY6_APHCR|nr:Uncharacterized protein FWK35_00001143 [Aphis craccivora]
MLLKTIGNFLLLSPQSTNLIHFLIRNETEFKNRSTFTALKRGNRHTKKKKTHISL